MINILSFFQAKRPIDAIASDTIFSLFDFRINSSTICAFLIFVLLAILCFFVIRKFKMKPTKTQVVIEMIHEAIEGLIFQILRDRKETRLILPFVGSLMIFIAISNLASSVPVLTSITFDGKGVFRAPTADFSTTLSLAVLSLLTIHIMSIRDYGIFGYMGRFIKVKEVYHGFRAGFVGGLIALVDFFIGFLDIISEFARIISISLRLFGNIFAGMVLSTVIFGIMAYVLPSFLLIMGLMFAVVQAVVFSSLVTVYYSLSMKPKENEVT